MPIDISNIPSSMPTSTTNSVYAGNHDQSETANDSFSGDNEMSIEQLQRQQEELIKMQNMIQQKMSTIQSAIYQRESRENRSFQGQARPIRNIRNNSKALAEYNRNAVPKVTNQKQQCKRKQDSSVSEYTSQYMTQSMLIPSNANYATEESVPLYQKETRSKSAMKRRTRQERYKAISTERVQTVSACRKKSVAENKSKFDQNVKFDTTFVSKIPVLKHNENKSRTTFCSRERTSFIQRETTLCSITPTTKCIQIEKSATMITRKTIETLKKIRATQSTIKVMRYFVRVLKLFNKKLNMFNERDNWGGLCRSLCNNYAVILSEIKVLPFKCPQFATRTPKLVDEINSQLFKRQKNVPACSTAFQKECKPFVKLLQNIIGYYTVREKSVEDRSNNSRSRSITKIIGELSLSFLHLQLELRFLH